MDCLSGIGKEKNILTSEIENKYLIKLTQLKNYEEKKTCFSIFLDYQQRLRL